MDFDLGMLILRLVVGGLFVGHGLQKLAGWFGGYGLDGTAQGMETLGLRPGRRNAVAAGLTETVGGALLAAGLLLPLAAVLLVAAMITAIRTVHLKSGVWNADGGYEYNLVLIVTALAVVAAGPGSIAIDGALGLDLAGVEWALGALVAGAIGSTAAIAAGHRAGADPAATGAAPSGA